MGVTFNQSKTVYMIMSKQIKRPPPVNLHLNCNQIDRVQYYWYLGRHTSQMFKLEIPILNKKVYICKFQSANYQV